MKGKSKQRHLYRICSPVFWRALVAEFIGTLLLVTLTSGTLRNEDPPNVPRLVSSNHLVIQHLYISITNGTVVFTLTLCLSAVCYTLFNPALALASLLTRRLSFLGKFGQKFPNKITVIPP